MKLNQRLYVAFFPVTAVHELSGLLQAKAYVVTAAPPLPPVRGDGGRGESDRGHVPATGFWRTLFTRALKERAGRAGPGDSVCDSSCSDGVHKPRLSYVSHEYLPHAPPLRGAVPPPVPELVRALRGPEGHAAHDLLQQARLVPADVREPAARTPVALAHHARVQDHGAA